MELATFWAQVERRGAGRGRGFPGAPFVGGGRLWPPGPSWGVFLHWRC